MIESLLDLPPNVRARLSAALASGLLPAPYSPTAVRSVLGMREGAEAVAGGLAELHGLGVSGPAAAAWIRAAERMDARQPKPDLVWSGPEVVGPHARDTRRVYEEVLGSAQRSVWAPRVFYDPRALDADGRGGVLHAKAVVADDEVVFITSANLTEAALDRNIELGLLVRDRTLAISVSTYFQALIDGGHLSLLPDD